MTEPQHKPEQEPRRPTGDIRQGAREEPEEQPGPAELARQVIERRGY